MSERLLWYISIYPRCIAMLVLVSALALAPGMSAWADEQIVTAAQAYASGQAGQRMIIDVRTPAEWRQTGMPAGSTAVSLHQADGLDGFLQGVLDAVDGDRAAPIAVICRTGNRSRIAHAFLVEHGFTNVQDVSEGMVGGSNGPGWLSRGLPVEACVQC